MLAVEWRQRRWRRLLSIIDQLPRDSRYQEAVTQDEQLAEQMLDEPEAEDQPAKPVRRLSEWSAEVEVLTSILNRLGELTQAVAMLGGAKPRRLPSAPYPTTVLEKLRKRRRDRIHADLVARVLPPKSTEAPPG